MIVDVLLDALLDTVKLIPFLFLTYFLMEYLEHKTKEKSKNMIKKAGKFGPFMGGVLGAFPQCGFSAAAQVFMQAGLYLWERFWQFFFLHQMKCFRFLYQKQLA